MHGHLFVLIGPNGAGKTSLAKRAKTVGLAEPIVTCTTRAPRVNETDGIDYYFLSPDRFEDHFISGKLVEREQIHGYWYGTPFAGIACALDSKKNAIIAMGFAGGQLVKERWPDSVSLVYIMPPSIEELQQRLKSRGDDPAEADRRLCHAQDELALADMADAVISNTDLDQAFIELQALINSQDGGLGGDKGHASNPHNSNSALP